MKQRLTDAERNIHDAGQVSILRLLHDRLDDAVADAYGWPRTLTAPEIVARVVALNAERAAEEASGQVRWLRPAYQAPLEAARRGQQQGALAVDQDAVVAERRWPKAEPEQFLALRGALRAGPVAAREIARRFKGAPRADRVGRMLETLTALGQAQRLDGGRFSA